VKLLRFFASLRMTAIVFFSLLLPIAAAPSSEYQKGEIKKQKAKIKNDKNSHGPEGSDSGPQAETQVSGRTLPVVQ
jgi:hypothetical protein